MYSSLFNYTSVQRASVSGLDASGTGFKPNKNGTGFFIPA